MRRITPTVILPLAAIGAILLTLTAGFAFAAGWLSPQRLSPRDIVDALQIHDGLHPGFRRAHAKGLCHLGKDVLLPVNKFRPAKPGDACRDH